jgi:hypothetical protein
MNCSDTPFKYPPLVYYDAQIDKWVNATFTKGGAWLPSALVNSSVVECRATAVHVQTIVADGIVGTYA